MNTIINCKGCEDTINTDDDAVYSSVIDSYICQGCSDDDMDTSGNVRIVNTNGEVETIFVGDYRVMNEYGDDSDLPVKRQWVSTDGWRGYHNTHIEGWVSVLTGWTTGGFDDSVGLRKRLFNNFAEYLLTNDIYPPCQVALITDSTSNAFSTAVTVQVPAKDEALFNEWLNSTEYTAEDLSHSLS